MKKYIASGGGNATRDPYVLLHENKYYRCFASEGNTISLACAESLAELAKANGRVVYTAEPNTPWSRELWAPELHVIDGKCYIYVACDDGENKNHRMYVLENHSNDPMKPYTMHGKITDATDKWAIDGTVLLHQSGRYFVWSGWEGGVNVCQNLYIAKMKDPFTLSTPRVCISHPEYEWEKRGATGKEESPFINEGAFCFEKDGHTYITYSASGSWCKDYCIALLSLVGDDPMDPAAWQKSSSPLLVSNGQIKGAGHCSIVKEADRLQLFFHAWDKDEKNVVWNTVSVWQAELVERDDEFCIQ